MKYFYFIGLLIILFAACAPKVKKEPPPIVKKPDYNYLWAYKKSANVRSTNSATSTKLTSLADGDSVQILQNKSGWYEIILANGNKGWIRSDLLGTKNMSVFPKAAAFSHKIKEEKGITLFFDKELQHKRIFLEFPENQYTSKQEIKIKVQDIGKRYQEKVYPGKVSIQVLDPKNQSKYISLDLPGSKNADISLPIIKFGILTNLRIINENELFFEIEINENIGNSQLLSEARKIAGSFPLTLKKVNVTFKNKSQICVLSFIEDASGEYYKFNQCL